MGKYIIHDFLKEDFPISQGYGENIEYYKSITNGALANGHEGLDIKTPNGTELFAPFDGVILRDSFDAKVYGTFLVIWDPIQCIGLWFCHLKDTPVQFGERVKVGQLIAHTNNTGRSSGPHCHVNLVETDREANRINTDNGFEGFLNLMDQGLVNFPFLPCAALVPVNTIPTTPLNTVLKAGDPIEVTMDIPVGAVPGEENFAYGRLSPTAPAQLIGVITINGVVYYNIDQAAIGGGTGYARADSVDANLKPLLVAHTAPVPEQPPVMPVEPPINTIPDVMPSPSDIPPVETNSDVKSLEEQRNDALSKAKEISDKYNEHMLNYTALIAAGYATIKDVEKAIGEVLSENVGLKKELLQVLKRNKTYHVDMAAKEEEDATAIEAGLNYESKFKDVQSTLTAIAHAHGTKPTLAAILFAIDRLRSSRDQILGQLKRVGIKQSLQDSTSLPDALTPPVIEETTAGWLKHIFGYSKKGGV